LSEVQTFFPTFTVAAADLSREGSPLPFTPKNKMKEFFRFLSEMTENSCQD
jgi:hypothetical protein